MTTNQPNAQEELREVIVEYLFEDVPDGDIDLTQLQDKILAWHNARLREFTAELTYYTLTCPFTPRGMDKQLQDAWHQGVEDRQNLLYKDIDQAMQQEVGK